MSTVVSGIRSTGNLHLGNYFGAVKNFIEMQHEHQTFFFIADFHSLTTHPVPGDLELFFDPAQHGFICLSLRSYTSIPRAGPVSRRHLLLYD